MATGAVEVKQLCGLQILQTSPHPDFFLWGFVKNDVYSQRPMDIDDLKEKICTAFQKVTPQVLHHTWDAISSRYELCRLRNGGHVEV